MYRSESAEVFINPDLPSLEVVTLLNQVLISSKIPFYFHGDP